MRDSQILQVYPILGKYAVGNVSGEPFSDSLETFSHGIFSGKSPEQEE